MRKSSFWTGMCQVWLLFFATATIASAQSFTTLAYFSDGADVFSSLMQGRDGNLYGTSNNGGVSGHGSVFKVTPEGTLTTLYSFCSQTGCIDGYYPFSALSLGIDGNLYGTTQNGGAYGQGTVFKITPSGRYNVLHSFNGADGSEPDAGLVLGSDGNFYGDTALGGANGSCLCGVLFKISPTGTLTVLHSFDFTDGDGPSAPMVQGSDGSFYGTTFRGGTSTTCASGCGTVFKMTMAGDFRSLHSFQLAYGEEPVAPLVQATDGAFYGTTFGGGYVSDVCQGGCGTIFKIRESGAFAVVHKFDFMDGGFPESALVQATDGSLYGENPLFGSGGEIYKFTLRGSLTTEYGFGPSNEGGGTALVQRSDGKFYGADNVPGAIFSFDLGLGPFVAFVIPTGKVGKKSQILGQGLTGATSVTFNGAPATSFSVASDTYMTAVVPGDATTGKVVITTPSGTLTSNVNFRITK